MATQYTQGGLGTWGVTSMWSSVSGGPYNQVWGPGNDAVFEMTPGTIPVSNNVQIGNITFNTEIVLAGGSFILSTPPPTATTLNLYANVELAGIQLVLPREMIVWGWVNDVTLTLSGIINNITTLGCQSPSKLSINLAGVLNGDLEIDYGCILTGIGSCNRCEVEQQAVIAPGNLNAALILGSVDFNGVLYPTPVCSFLFNGPTYADCDHINYTKYFDIRGTDFKVTLGYAPAIGDMDTVIHGVPPNALNVIGTFNGLSEGSTLHSSYNGITYAFIITYVGGTGYDVVLTCIGV